VTKQKGNAQILPPTPKGNLTLSTLGGKINL